MARRGRRRQRLRRRRRRRAAPRAVGRPRQAIRASVAVNGVCLTVVENDPASLGFDLSEETLRRTALNRLRPGSPVNLERPVTLATRLGGHVVQGHVDGVGSIAGVERNGAGAEVAVETPDGLGRYLIEE